jgi:preprotein translocase subunit SecA
MSFLTKIFGTAHDRDMRIIRPYVDQINALEPKMKELSDEQLQAKTGELKGRLAGGETVDDLMVDAFAVCREAAWRVLKMRHYDVQLVGGYVLHKGSIAEMRTGEGKTLVATLPVYLNALTGKGVHVVTVNDYLAKRDAEWMGQVYRFLGLTTATVTHELGDAERKQAYEADITYCTNNELGFDYLRDNMKYNLSDYVQRPLHYAIVDECDSILIDEARTPLIISGPAEDNTEIYLAMHKVAKQLTPEQHFTMEEKNRSVALTEEGNTALEQIMGIENIFDPQHIDNLHHIYQSLKAIHLFKKDVDYMVQGNEIVIVDEFTGRLMEGRRWSDGLHQAVEAKEGVKIKNENQTLASITFQNYFRMYEKLAGMTGTADTEATEFQKIYGLNVHVIPTNKPMIRKDQDDVVYKSEDAKFNAIISDIKERQEIGQPVLVGTVSIERSEKIGRALGKHKIPHNVLNAKHHEREAEIVSQAGRKGAITIATNMAGRGTDIVLGGNAEALALKELGDPDHPDFKTVTQKYQKQCDAEKKEVLEAGGLYIIGTERHESRRIDNQLRGRSGRQGDPGESRFFLSLEDDLMRKFNGERIKKIMTTLNVPEDEPITAKMVTRSIENAQRKVEGHNFEIRKHLLEYDDVMNHQRKTVYAQRRQLLEEDEVGENRISATVVEMLSEVTSNILDSYASENVKREHWDLKGLAVALENQFGIEVQIPDGITGDRLNDLVVEKVKERFEAQKKMMEPIFEDVQKSILLSAIDHYWKEHLQRVDRIREWVNLKAYAQKDPLLEYKKETFQAFEEMNELIHRDTIEKLMKVQVRRENQADVEEEREEVLEAFRPQENQRMQEGRGAMMGAAGPESDQNSSLVGSQGQQGLSRAQRRRHEKSKKKKKLF